MYERILVPLDGMPFGEYAIRYATSIALRSGAALELTHVHIPAHLESELFAVPLFHYTGIAESDAAYDHELLEREREQLAGRARQLAERTGLEVTSQVVVGSVDRGVEREAEAFGADLIVMSTHGRAGMERARLGSVGDAVVRHAHSLVLLVHPPSDEAAAPERPVTFERILVPLDGTEFSERILDAAARLATLFGAEVRLLHVQTSPPMRTFRRVVRDEAGGEATLDLLAEEYLDHVATVYAETLPDASLEIAVAKSPLVGILESVQAWRPDLIAMATHARGGLTRMLLGSTSSEVVRAVGVPVLLMRPQDRAPARPVAEVVTAPSRA